MTPSKTPRTDLLLAKVGDRVAVKVAAKAPFVGTIVSVNAHAVALLGERGADACLVLRSDGSVSHMVRYHQRDMTPRAVTTYGIEVLS